jgi:hypothetical protein
VLTRTTTTEERTAAGPSKPAADLGDGAANGEPGAASDSLGRGPSERKYSANARNARSKRTVKGGVSSARPGSVGDGQLAPDASAGAEDEADAAISEASPAESSPSDASTASLLTEPVADTLAGAPTGVPTGAGVASPAISATLPDDPSATLPGDRVLDEPALDRPGPAEALTDTDGGVLDSMLSRGAALDAGATEADGVISGRGQADVAAGSTVGGGTEDRAAAELSSAVRVRAISPATTAAEDGTAAETDWPAFVTGAVRLADAWARRRGLGLSSACGIFVALAVCAATWFSAGSRTGNIRAVVALWTGYLVLLAGQKLAGAPAMRAGQWTALRGTAVLSSVKPGLRAAYGAERRQAGPASWLAALGGWLGESIVYAGLAAGAVAEHWAGMWTLATAVLGLVGVRSLMTACSSPPGLDDESDGALRRASLAVLTMPVGGRLLLIGIVAPVWGARAALLAVLDWAIISVGYGLAGRAVGGIPADPGAPDNGASATLLRLRDDGALARGLGAFVRGGLLPLPPALLGLLASSALAIVGLHGLPGVLMLGPAVVMLLAAPGAGHPHGGRFDWLVPVILLGSQVIFFSAAGLAAGVPGPVIFVLDAALLLRYCDLAFPGRPVLLSRPRHVAGPAGRSPGSAYWVERGTWLGWEGRLLFIGIGAALGVATFAYVALSAYLGVLICAKVVASSLAPQEGTVRDRPGYGGRRQPPLAS